MNLMSGVRRLAREALALLCAWWRVDRVRVSPREGRLLRLEPPCFLIVDGRLAEVLGREQDPSVDGRLVVYSCLTDSGRGELRVALHGPGRQLEVRWVDTAGEKSLTEEEIAVYPSRA